MNSGGERERPRQHNHPSEHYPLLLGKKGERKKKKKIHIESGGKEKELVPVCKVKQLLIVLNPPSAQKKKKNRHSFAKEGKKMVEHANARPIAAESSTPSITKKRKKEGNNLRSCLTQREKKRKGGGGEARIQPSRPRGSIPIPRR